MISALRQLRLSRSQLALVASLSALATALVIATALGRTAAQTAALAALRQRPEIVHVAPVREPATEPATGASDSAGPGTPASPVTPSPAAAPSPSAGSGAGSTTSASSTTSAGSTTDGSGSSPTTTSAGKTAAPQRHKVGHVFVIALSTTSFEAAFGKSSVAHYLNRTLRRQGTLLGGYESLGGTELPDYMAMISGQAPNSDTRRQCSTYAEFAANTKPASNGQVPGAGCVYPNTIITIGDQVTASGHVWKAFIGDMQPSTCVHPNSNAPDDAPLPGAGPQYATRHNPFIYFHSLLDLGGCSSNDVSLARLPRALRSRSATPSYTFIAPRACDDAAVQACPAGRRGGLAAEDAFLKQWVPRIRRSPAYRRNGVLLIAFAPTSTAAGSLPTGALVLSRYAARDKTIGATYNAYSLLRSTEDLLGYKPLARAKAAKSFADAALPGR